MFYAVTSHIEVLSVFVVCALWVVFVSWSFRKKKDQDDDDDPPTGTVLLA